ncbi:hypothetical protein FD33_GL000061 [Companilactobacillus paralimentarius DSM 13238 = JCM 10415]|uniref:Uncharacterized protein n=1 Tax=Companilactobacillus paralimentarius DSM 13238 = JCM 10415 TaxID=1122151 RepID=A0A0R1PDZ2_9LACO|nr:hypothetical protein FD33_GL000061 [Companilactobacillus paralimentarius DSM 13238 = JCM 10415]
MGPISELIGANKYLLSLRDGFMLAFPATMFGSIMVILQNLPTTFGFGGFLPKWFNGEFYNQVSHFRKMTK